MIMSFLRSTAGLLWGPATMLFLLTAGAILTIKSRFYPITGIKAIFRNTFGSLRGDGNGVSPFMAVSTALAGTMGVGNIAGVATAITAGGPGAVFWMWTSAFFCMMIKYAEITLALRYREKRDGQWLGGAMLCLEKGLNNRPVAVMFSVCCAASSFGIGNLSQSNTISAAFQGAFGIKPLTIGLLLAIIVGLSVAGGISSISRIATAVVPLVSLGYIAAALTVLIAYSGNIPNAFSRIFIGAFSLQSIGGGVMGYTIARAMRFGIARGIFTHEAGMGSSPIAHCSVDSPNPYRQGYWGIAEVFFDTHVVCTLTALVILATGSDGISALDGVALTTHAFGTVFGSITPPFMAISILLFAYASILGWSYYGERALSYLSGNASLRAQKNARNLYRAFFILSACLGAVARLEAVWLVSDILCAMMMFPNMYMVIKLHNEALKGLDKSATAYVRRTSRQNIPSSQANHL